MNSELKKQVLESLKSGATGIRVRMGMLRLRDKVIDLGTLRRAAEGIEATIAAVESEPEPTQKLTSYQIESCFPDGGDTNENGITVSAQWLHDFARNVESKISVTPVRVWNERDVEIVRATLAYIMKKWHYDFKIKPESILDSLKGK